MHSSFSSEFLSSELSDELRTKLAQPLKIGSVVVNSRVFQSPLSGVTDLVFRRLVRRYAPNSMIYTEMVHAREIHHLNHRHNLNHQGELSANRAIPRASYAIASDEDPISIQLFDSRPDFMAEAARLAVAEGASTIDINMGCPVNKITKKGGGSSLLRQPEVAEAIVKTVVEAVDIPVTVKTRLGWDDDEINIIDFARRLEAQGAQMLTLHGRTRAQGYNGNARWEWISQVKQALTIPVIANGDIFSVAAAIECLKLTNADGVMCSRGTLGYPFLVGEIDHFLQTGEILPPISVVTRLECAKEHLLGLWEYKGQRGIYQSRKHLAWYCHDFSGAAELRDRLSQIKSLEEGIEILNQAILGFK